jgi:eukaryotic-like serine/threonine-protein kinase
MATRLLHYEVLERLGEGARSTIYAVSDPETRQVYALKHVVRNEPKDIRFIEQMEAEYAISKDFHHPNLRRCYELKISKTLLVKVSEAFLLMELFDGRPLDTIRLDPKTQLPEIVEVFLQAARGLQAMHQAGYVHCDIKPNNILRNEHGDVKVIDYGQSTKIGVVKERIQGTPDYIAPEQVSRRPVSPQTDVFNLGATLYWSLTGKNIPTLYTVNKKGDNSFLLDAAIDSPADLNPSVPPALSNLTMEMVSTNPRKRPETMEQVIVRLELVKHVLQRDQAQRDADQAPPMDKTA